MRFSTVTCLGSLATLSTAYSHTVTTNVEVDVVCTDPAPSTVYSTVTVTAPLASNYAAATTKAPWVTTHDGIVTSCEYNNGLSTVHVYPTGGSNYDSTVVVYNEITVISIVLVNIDITIIDGQTTTIISTKTDQPTSTPAPPPSQTTTTSTSSTSSAVKATHTVVVGGPNLLKFTPPSVNAALGDTIHFDFLVANHTLTQSELATPCTFNGKFDTGFNQFNPDNVSGLKTVDFVVNGTKPLWFYCKQNTHCSKGMVFAINPAGKFDQFLANALATGNGTAPVAPTAPRVKGRAAVGWKA